MSKPKSSINFRQMITAAFWHNAREGFQAKSVFQKFTHLNECNLSATEARKKATELKQTAISNYEKKFNQKFQGKDENIFWECVLNLGENHTMKDVEKVADLIQQKLGYTPIQMAIHRDEGHWEGDKFIPNLHAHICFFCLDEDGRNLARKNYRNRQLMSEIQTQVAEILNLERGEIGSKNKRLEHREYKLMKQLTAPLENEIKQLKNELKRLQKRAISHENYKEELEKIELELMANDKKWRKLFADGCSVGNADLYKVIIDQTKSEIEQLKLKKQEIQDKIKKQEIEEATEKHDKFEQKIENITSNKAQNALKSAIWSTFKSAINEMKKEKMDYSSYAKISDTLNSKLEMLSNVDILALSDKELDKFIDKITDINAIKSNVLLQIGDEFSKKQWQDGALEHALKSSLWNSIFIAGALVQSIGTLLSRTSKEHKRAKNELLDEIHDLKAQKVEKSNKNDEILKAKVDKLASENSMYKISTLNLLNENSELKAQNKELKATQTPQNSTTTELEIENERLQNRAKLSEIHALKMTLKAHVAGVREQLREAGAQREHYAHLEQLNRDCADKIESLKTKDVDLKLLEQTYDLIPNWISSKAILNSPQVATEIERKKKLKLQQNSQNFGFGR
ncbi:hypothetical protein [Campylobacter geochelonis]|uniref:Mobilization protein n=1 Tax=Campylobacter geochelonis TaxID=1780362 RepID=A0A128EKH2_9BACT|nr:hypothetical protein [Campylobacter geochelonis]QKF71206.1 hypothetical protein CGEO_0887 [Campylobacter geochelonis]CZE48838.1 mobilization protein [Campylobacter geochelonis]